MREPGGRLTAEPNTRRGPGLLVRALGRSVNSAVARFPWSWRLFSYPVRRFSDSVAVGWDERVRSDSPEYLEPLVAALDRLKASPGRILDSGAGTGAAALELADRYPDAEVVGIDVSAEMVAQAKAKAADRSTPVWFLVADIASFEDDEGFDLIAMLNMPPFFDRVIALPEVRRFRGQRQLLRLAHALLHPAGAVEARLRAPGRPHGRRRAGRPGHLLPRPTGVAGPAARSDRLPLRAVDPERSPLARVPLCCAGGPPPGPLAADLSWVRLYESDRGYANFAEEPF